MLLKKIAQKIFGSTSGINQVGVFGSLAAGSPTTIVDPIDNPEDVQSLANWNTGWFGAVMGNNSPAIEDMNAFCFFLSYQIAYLQQFGVAEWDADTEYYEGSFVSVDGIIYVSVDDNNQGNPIDDVDYWKKYVDTSMLNFIRDISLRGHHIRTTPVVENISAIAYSPSLDLFVAFNDDTAVNNIVTSKNGIDWVSTAIPSHSVLWHCVCWSDTLNKFVAIGVGATSKVATSSDGITWTLTNVATFNNTVLRRVIWSSNLNRFIAIGGTATPGKVPVWYSADGLTWTTATAPVLCSFSDIVYSESLNRFVCPNLAPSVQSKFYYSADGITWTASAAAPSGATPYFIAWSPKLKLFYATDSSNGMVFTSPDGINWTSLTSPSSTPGYVVWSKSLECFIMQSSSLIYSIDGVNWKSIGPFWNTIFNPASSLFCEEKSMLMTGSGFVDPGKILTSL